MSAFQVSPAHIARVIAIADELCSFRHERYAHGGPRFPLPSSPMGYASPGLEPETIFTALAAMNARSVGYRYNEEVTPVPYEAPRSIVLASKADYAAAIKVVDCYVYQSCECRERWQGSAVEQFCTAIREALIRLILGADYSAAPWSITSQVAA